jgi:hypothetical protein
MAVEHNRVGNDYAIRIKVPLELVQDLKAVVGHDPQALLMGIISWELKGVISDIFFDAGVGRLLREEESKG